MTLDSSRMLRSARIIRPAARCAAAAAAAAAGVSIYTALAGPFRLEVGPLRISASAWAVPLLQACLCAAAAAGLFYRDAAVRAEWDSLPRRLLTGGPAAVTCRLLWAALSAGALTSLVVCFRMARQSLVLGSAEGGWIFDFVEPLGAPPLLMFALAGAAASGMLGWRWRGDRSGWRTPAAWLAVALGLQAMLRTLTPFGFAEIFASAGANAFYSVTQGYDAASVLGHFNSLRDSWPVHAQSNMPGKLMLVYAFELLSARPAVLAWLVVAFSNLGGVLLYVLVRDLFGDRRVALYSLVLYLFVPGKLFFFPLLNTATPVVALAWAVLAQRWLLTGRAWFAAGTGIGCYAVAMFDPLALVLGLLFVALAARAILRGAISPPALAAGVGLGAAALLASYGVMRVWTGFDLVDALRHVSADAILFNAQAARPYDIWVRQNIWDFLFAAGSCQTILFGAALAHGLSETGWTRPAVTQPIVLFCLALFVMVVALDLAGVNRGEVVRLWIFLQCLLQVPAAYVCARLNDRRAIGLVVLLTILQGALGTSTIGFVLP